MPTPRQPIACPEPGVHMDIPMDEYHQIDAANASTLKKAEIDHENRCWADVKVYLDGEAELPRYPMYEGRAAHAALLEGNIADLIEIENFTNPETGKKNKIGDACKPVTLLACQEEFPDNYIVGEGGIDKINAMVAQARAHETIGPLLDLESQRELTLIWKDEKTGLMCKARLDWWIPLYPAARGLIMDYKTALDVKRHKFEKQIIDFGYYLSTRFYRRGVIACGLDPDPAVRIIAQGKTGSHQCRIWWMHEQLEEIADRIIDELLGEYAQCQETGIWPGYKHENLCATPPLWLVNKLEGAA